MLRICTKVIDTFRFWLKLDKITATLCEDLRNFVIYNRHCYRYITVFCEVRAQAEDTNKNKSRLIDYKSSRLRCLDFYEISIMISCQTAGKITEKSCLACCVQLGNHVKNSRIFDVFLEII